MKTILCLLVLVALRGHAQPGTDLDELKKLNARFIHNFVTNDAAAHDKILHAKFVCITARGKWVNRADYLEAWKTGFDPAAYAYWDYRDEQITVFGTTALVRAVNKYVVVKDGKETTGMTQYTDTYVKEGGAWKCVQAQLTEVAPAHYPPDATIVRKYVHGE